MLRPFRRHGAAICLIGERGAIIRERKSRLPEDEMPFYRITVRHGRPQQYAMQDVEADSLAEALRFAAEEMTVARSADADLAEIRVQMDPAARTYAGE
jgi:hypothetical protein